MNPDPIYEECSVCNGEGEVTFNHGWPDPQTEDYAVCVWCDGTGLVEHECEAAA